MLNLLDISFDLTFRTLPKEMKGIWLGLNRPPVAGFDSTGDRIEAKIPEIFAMIFLFFNHSERQNPVPVIATMASKIPKYPVPGKRIPAYTSGLA